MLGAGVYIMAQRSKNAVGRTHTRLPDVAGVPGLNANDDDNIYEGDN